ncbi:phage major capsid family protein [Inquilinus sp. CA228]|uniref:phage major capsid family protein n=1 Tax=Inquilinus sp. CA228 TaxID=3455609 RepID=UPI003F8D53CC
MARALLAGRGDPLAAALFVEGAQPESRAARILRAAVAAGTISDPAWAGALSGYRMVSDSFIESLRPASVFVRLFEDRALRVIPIGIAIAVTTTGATGSAPAEGKPKLISRLTLTADQTQPKRATAVVVTGAELARSTTPGAAALLAAELKGAVTAALDDAFMATISEGVTPIVSSGSTPAQIADDLRAMLSAVNTTGAGRLYWMGDAEMANGFSTATTTSGAPAYPGTSPNGGELIGVPFLVTDTLAAGEMILVDAAGLAGTIDLAVLDSANHATLQMADDPIDGPAALVSLWATDSAALRCEVWYALEKIRSNAAAQLTGLNFGGTT